MNIIYIENLFSSLTDKYIWDCWNKLEHLVFTHTPAHHTHLFLLIDHFVKEQLQLELLQRKLSRKWVHFKMPDEINNKYIPVPNCAPQDEMDGHRIH